MIVLSSIVSCSLAIAVWTKVSPMSPVRSNEIWLCQARLVMLHVFAISLLPSGDIVYDLAKKANFQWQVKVLKIDFNAKCWCNLAVAMLATLSRLSHCNHFILLWPPLARLLYGTNDDPCDGLEEQGHDGHCHLGTLHGDQCYCHDHGTNHEGAGCLLDWQVIDNKMRQSLTCDDSFHTFVDYVPEVMIGHCNSFSFSQDKGLTFHRVKLSRHVFCWELLQ